MKKRHPYMEFERTDMWVRIKKAIDDLVENQDIEITTREEYVIGYLCASISETKPK